jgi:hypothetical protein
MMLFALVSLVLVLVLVVTLNRGYFERLGVSGTARLLLIWAVVFAGLALVGRLLGMV